jgi:hypothetical protein
MGGSSVGVIYKGEARAGEEGGEEAAAPAPPRSHVNSPMRLEIDPLTSPLFDDGLVPVRGCPWGARQKT